MGSYDSCGTSGDKYCTFGFNNPAKDAKELCQKSEPTHCGASSEKNHCGSSTSEANAGGADKNSSDE
jgi:hypothetical protein